MRNTHLVILQEKTSTQSRTDGEDIYTQYHLNKSSVLYFLSFFLQNSFPLRHVVDRIEQRPTKATHTIWTSIFLCT